MTKNGVVLAGLLVLGLAACEEKGTDPAAPGSGKSKSSSSPASSSTTSTSTAAAPKPEASPDKDAFLMGRKMGFASSYALLEKGPEKDKALSEAATFAAALKVPAPALNDGGAAMNELKKAHNDKVAAAYLVGYYVTDAWFGAQLDADVNVPLGKVEENAKAAGIPDSVWKEKLEACKPKASDATVNALVNAFEGHFGGG